ncbi:MAG: hypothetical protein ACXITV_12060 [Luteibaculaceae bacterium]
MKDSTINSVLGIVRIVLALLGAALMVYVAGKWDKDINNVDAINGALDLTLWLVYAIIIVAGVIIVGFGLYSVLSKAKENLGLLAGLGGFALVLIIAWATASVESDTFLKAAYGLSPNETGVSKYAGAGVNSVFYLIIIAAVAVIASEVTKIFK